MQDSSGETRRAARPITSLRWLAIPFFASMLILLAIALRLPTPAPQFHDEFSYLLAADTFAHGRLTNSPHALPEFFETFQELTRPTYASKYPPAQGLAMALGIFLAHAPLLGVWLSTAAACAAIAWMLRARFSRRWSILGALLVAAHPQTLDWSFSYWGGSVALLGGALVIGATLRAMRRPQPALGWFAGVGISLLANTRPLEGSIVVALCAISLIVVRRQRRRIARSTWRRLALRGAIILIPAFAWTAYYNHRVTGNALLMPYISYESQYAPGRPLAWMPPRATQPTYRNAQMTEYYLHWEYPRYTSQRSLGGFLHSAAGKLADLIRQYFREPTLALSFLAIPFLWRSRRRRLAIWAAVLWIFCVLNALPVVVLLPHYLAPASGAVIVLLVALLRALWSEPRSPVGRAMGRTIVMLILSGQLAAAGRWVWIHTHGDTSGFKNVRRDMIDDLTASGEKYLVFVHPLPGYDVHFEWVYNEADIDASPVVWARDLGFEQNRRLIDYYRSRQPRHVTRLDVSDTAAQLINYPEKSPERSPEISPKP